MYDSCTRSPCEWLRVRDVRQPLRSGSFLNALGVGITAMVMADGRAAPQSPQIIYAAPEGCLANNILNPTLALAASRPLLQLWSLIIVRIIIKKMLIVIGIMKLPMKNNFAVFL